MKEVSILQKSRDSQGNEVIVLPITKLENVEDTSDIIVKTEISNDKYIPITDSSKRLKKVKFEDLKNLILKNVPHYIVLDSRIRDPEKPKYNSGEIETLSATIEASSYTGKSEVAINLPDEKTSIVTSKTEEG